MINTLTKKLQEKNNKKYDFKPNCKGIAGFCPDCGGFVSFNSYHHRFECLDNDCCFMANENCERIWDNSMREANLKKLEEESKRQSRLNINI